MALGYARVVETRTEEKHALPVDLVHALLS